jgi:hypothetical protein
MKAKFDKKNLKSLSYILETMIWSKKTISRYCPFKRTPWRNTGTNREYLALNVYVALCYYKLDYYDVSQEVLATYLQAQVL